MVYYAYGRAVARVRGFASLKGWTSRLLTGISLTSVAALATGAHADSWTMYDSYKLSYFIPFAEPPKGGTYPPDYTQSDATMYVAAQLNLPGVSGGTGNTAAFRVDTGSMGMVVPAYLVPGYNGASDQTHTFVSSGNTVTGHWTLLSVTFPGAAPVDGVLPTATIPVFVEMSAHYADTGNTEDCTNPASPCILQLGIGYNRPSHDDNVATTPAFNPLINIAGMGGTTPTMRAGYVITDQGIQVGLTSQNAGSNFSVVKLAPSTTNPGDWQTLPGQFYVNGVQVTSTNAALLDSGLPYVWGDFKDHVTPTTCPSGTIGGNSCAPGGVSFTITLGAPGNPNSVSYTYTEGGDPKDPVAPPYTRTNTDSTLNTGMFVFGGFTYFYDAAGGYIGLSQRETGSSVTFSASLAITGALTLSSGFASDLPIYVYGASVLTIPDVASLEGEVTGPEALTFAGPGNAFLSGNVTLPKGLHVAGGGVTLGATTTANVTVSQGSVLINTGTLTGNASNAGFLLNTGTLSGTVTTSGTAQNTGQITGEVINSGSLTNAGTITGAVRNDEGTLVNAGLIQGPVHNSGTLSNDGVISGTVTSGGTLIGNGRITGDLVLAGHLAPGHSIGSVDVDGSVTLAAGSVYTAEIGAAGTADILRAKGTIVSDGSTLRVLTLAGIRPTLDAGYTVMTAAGGVSGRFTLEAPDFGSASSLYPFLAGEIVASGDRVGVRMARSSIAFADLALTPNQRAAAAAVDRMSASGALASQLATVTHAEAPAAFTQLEGQIYASAQSVLMQQASYLRTAVTGRLLQSEAPSGTGIQAVAMPGLDGLTLWGQAYAGWGTNDGNLNAGSASSSLSGFVMGLDGAVSGWRLGMAGGFSQSRYEAGGGAGSSDNYDLAVYAGRSFGPVRLRLGASYTWHDVSASRTVAFATLAENGTANYGGGTAQVFGELGYAIPLGLMGTPAVLEPIAGLSHARLSLDGFSEGIGAAALAGADSRFDMTATTLGLRGSISLPTAGTSVQLSGLLGWQHAFGDLTPDSTLTFSGSALPFGIAGPPLAADALVVSAGLSTALTQDLTLAVNYNGQWSTGITENAVKGVFTWAF